jgi:hypothetical protein
MIYIHTHTQNFFTHKTIQFSPIFLDCFILEDATDKLSQNIGKQLTTHDAQ